MTEDTQLRVEDVEGVAFSDYEPSKRSLGRESHFEASLGRTFSAAGNLAEVFHENTKYVQNGRLNAARTGEFRTDSVERVLARTEPRYADYPTVALPDPRPVDDRTLGSAVSDRRTERSFSGEGVDLERLATLLGRAFGTTGVEDRLELEKSLRAYPSPGGLYPVEAYVAAVRVDGLDPGVYHYAPDDHELARLRSVDWPAGELPNDLLLTDEDAFDGAAAGVFLTGVLPRALSKYGPRGYRYVLQESGHMAQNAQLLGRALDLGVVPVGGYDDRAVDDLLGVDGVDEATVYALVLGAVA